MIGKKIRIERIINRKTGRTVIVPVDHGVSIGPVAGITNMCETIDEVASGGANAVIMHKGMVDNGHRGYGTDIGLIIHLSASTSLGPD
ncbi:MAG TPA: fructose-bisphosphate aldolase, partial [Methanobacterium sp.]|nr:fructose-bisphosphate aldolase [Methanobacterium sp.]